MRRGEIHGDETQPERQAWTRAWTMPPGYQSPSGSSNSAQKAITRRASGSRTSLKNYRCSSGFKKSCQPSMPLAPHTSLSVFSKPSVFS